jgi:hypothetical protein
MGRFAAALVLAIASAAWAQSTAPKPARVALVIGNGAYAGAPLPNPVNDASDIAKELESAGFTVIRRQNAGLKEMHLALREFGDKLGKTSTGLFYFAGHGVQVRGRNYLLPVDADIAREDEVAFSAIDLGAVMEKLDSARNPLNIVILDACRDNPFGNRLQASAKGLAQVEAPPGTIIAFSTAPGSTAADGAGRNGLYTGHLLAQMRKPAPIEETFKAVRAGVRRDSQGRQIPWESTSLEGEFAFREMPVKVAALPPPAAAKPGGASRAAISASAPPTFAAGDTWTYRYENLLENKQSRSVLEVKDVQGAQVYWQDGNIGDLVGNLTRIKRGGDWRLYTPSSQMYVFPLNPGSAFTLKAVENVKQNVTFDLEVKIAIGGEEEVAAPAGRFRAIRIDREVKWVQREKPEYAGVNTWVYWYSGAAKRFVVATQSNVTTKGKQLQLDRWELESYKVR